MTERTLEEVKAIFHADPVRGWKQLSRELAEAAETDSSMRDLMDKDLRLAVARHFGYLLPAALTLRVEKIHGETVIVPKPAQGESSNVANALLEDESVLRLACGGGVSVPKHGKWVVVFTDAHFEGSHQVFGPGDWPYPNGWEIPNDTISSLYTGHHPNLRVKMWEHQSGGGKRQWGPNSSDRNLMDSGFNDTVSHIIVET